MVILMRWTLCITLVICVSFTTPVSAENATKKLETIWNKLSTEGQKVLDQSLQSLREITSEIESAIDAEINELIKDKTLDNKTVLLDKIDSIRIYVDNIADLKRKEENASSFTLFGQSKKDYRVKIDGVLRDIEPILFDGQVVDYASKIRQTRSQIKSLENQKVALNEKIITAPAEKTIIRSSKDDIKDEIEQIDNVINKLYRLIDELEFDLKRKLDALGIKVTRAQIRVMTTRVDGDELARSFAIFDVTKQISRTLGELVIKNSFSGSASVKYYGTYVILSEILAYSQREYIRKIEEIYIPALDTIKNNIEDTIDFTESSMRKSNSERSRKILTANISSNKFSLKVLRQYTKMLELQVQSLQKALKNTKEQITVAYSTYDTAANSANLVNLIDETQDSFNRIMDMQLPDIIPFENSELEIKFQEISGQIIDQI